MSTSPAAALVKPLLRGWSHAAAALLAVVGAGYLLLRPGRFTWALLVYALSMILLFTGSAVYHIPNWRPAVRAWLRRFDHANIFLLIAGTYTPLVAALLSGTTSRLLLAAVWTLGIAGALVVALALRIPRRLLAALYIAFGWVAAAVVPQLVAVIGSGAALVLLAGGLQYSVGGLAYALKWPRLWPRVFGYHELFHLLVVSASATFYGLILHYAA